MKEIVVTKADLIGALADGTSPTALAFEVGCDVSSVLRAEARYGIRLPRREYRDTPAKEIIEAAGGMRPGDAVEFLTQVLSDVMGAADTPECRWPGIKLTGKPYQVTLFLYRNEGIAKSRNQIIHALYAANEDPPQPVTINANMTLARRAIAGTGAIIETIHGVGYRFSRDPGTVFPWEKTE